MCRRHAPKERGADSRSPIEEPFRRRARPHEFEQSDFRLSVHAVHALHAVRAVRNVWAGVYMRGAHASLACARGLFAYMSVCMRGCIMSKRLCMSSYMLHVIYAVASSEQHHQGDGPTSSLGPVSTGKEQIAVCSRGGGKSTSMPTHSRSGAPILAH